MGGEVDALFFFPCETDAAEAGLHRVELIGFGIDGDG